MLPKDSEPKTFNGQFNFRLTSTQKNKFTKLCRDNRVTMSEALLAYIQKCIDAETILGMELAPPPNTVQTSQSDERLAALEAQVAALSAKFEGAIATQKQENNQPGKLKRAA